MTHSSCTRWTLAALALLPLLALWGAAPPAQANGGDCHLLLPKQLTLLDAAGEVVPYDPKDKVVALSAGEVLTARLEARSVEGDWTLLQQVSASHGKIQNPDPPQVQTVWEGEAETIAVRIRVGADVPAGLHQVGVVVNATCDGEAAFAGLTGIYAFKFDVGS